MTTISSHGVARMQQRGLRHQDIDLLLAHGTCVGDRVVFSNKDAASRITQLKREIERCERLKGKCIVVRDDVVVTAFHATADQIHRVMHK